ncbi:MAG TPA: NAD(P)-dependent alcohol dehydrogenase [Caulobacteraceae bacterium]|nr:NAD(P)-dependent alcohol dehydrogenase [Caulobacteraceae bacterium]
MTISTPSARPQAGALTRVPAAVVRERGGAFTLEEIDLAPPWSDEVVVRIEAVGMCHTDIAVRDGEMPSPLPAVLGHEGAGRVVAAGAAVTDVAVGDPVVLTYLSCGQCRECVGGAPASCAQLGGLCFGGGRPDGSHALCGHGGEMLHDRFFGQSSFAAYAVANRRNIVKVRSDAPLRLLGPLGCGIMTGAGAVWNALDVKPGSSVAVFGAGAVGLSGVMAARVAGATTIIAVDIVPSRLALALEMGATHVIDGGKEDVVAAIRAIVAEGTDFALDTTGREAVVRNAMLALRQRGVAALVAAAQPELRLDMFNLLAGCKTICGVIEGGGAAHLLIPRILDLYMAGRFPFDRMVRFYAPDQINEALRDSISGDAVKPVIRFDDDVLEAALRAGAP